MKKCLQMWIARAFAVACVVTLAALAAIGVSVAARPTTAQAAETFDVWDGDLIAAGWNDVSTDIWVGTPNAGKTSAPAEYVIDTGAKTIRLSSAAALAYFSHEVYIDTAHALDGYTVTLESNVDLDNHIWIPIGQTDRSDDPTRMFSGTFLAQNHTIKNLDTEKFFQNLGYVNSKYCITYMRASDSQTVKIPFTAKGDEEYSYGLFGVTSNITVKNLTVSGVKMSFEEISSLGTQQLLPDSFGAIIGYSSGSVIMEDCVAGSIETQDSITIVTDNNGSYGGLVGRIYGGINSARTRPYGNVKFENCVNYITLDYSGISSKLGGIVGYAQFFDECIIENCDNYGDVIGGQYVGGITSYWSNQDEGGDWVFKIRNCNNYGDIIGRDDGASGKDAGGIIGQLRGADNNSKVASHAKLTIAIENCNNYGAVSGYNSRVGGIMGWFRNTAGATTAITDCFNFGEVRGDDTASVGGLMAWYSIYYGDFTTTPEQLTVSGGNCGSVIGGRVNGGTFGSNEVGNNKHIIPYIINASNIRDGAVKNADTQTATAALVFDPDDNTVVTGVTVAGEGSFTVNIPANVTAIADKAFIGREKLVGVTFAENSSLTEVGDWAFAGTGIKAITLPEGLQTIGAAAFGNSALCKVTVPQSVTAIAQGAFCNCGDVNDILNVTMLATEAVCASGAFGENDILLTADATAYAAVDKVKLGDFADNLTYSVTVDFRNTSKDNALVDSVKRLYNRAFNVVEVDGVWHIGQSRGVGTNKIGYTEQWFLGAQPSGEPLTEADVAALLAESGLTELTLYAAIAEPTAFIFRDDLVYDGTIYTAANINALLAPNSKRVKNETVVIHKDNFDGQIVTEICNAGTYSITIGDNDAQTVVVAKAKIDLANLSTYTFRVNNGALLDRTVYVIGNSEVTLTQPTSGEYVTRAVLDSVVRKSETPLTLTLMGEGYTATVQAGSSNQASTVGAYTTVFTVRADTNYEFGTIANGNIAIPGATARGLSVNRNNNMVTVTKVWYVADMANWLIGIGGSDYSVADGMYGERSIFTQPALAHTATTGGGMTYTLRYDNTDYTFNRDEWNDYFNDAMPVGRYVLTVAVEAGEYGDVTSTPFGAFETVVSFAITPAEILPTAVEKIRNALRKDSAFAYIRGEVGRNQATIDTVTKALGDAFELQPSVATGSVWAKYSGAPTIEVNLASNLDGTFTAYAEQPTAGVYTYYYRIIAPNYAVVASDDMRFTVAEYAVVPVPQIAAKPYNGATQIADVAGNALYSVVNLGGVDQGEYEVTLTLLNPECHLWEGQTLDGDNDPVKNLTVTITQATNEWSVNPTMQNWVKGKFDKTENVVTGSALFGFDGMRYIVTDTSEKHILFDSRTDSTDKLAKLKAGDYYVKVIIDPTKNYTGLERGSLFHVFNVEGLPWWGVLLIVLGSLAIAAAVLFILWKKGVFQILTGKLVLAIRTRATVDATIAAVRANKKAEEAKKSIARAKARDAAAARRKKAAEEKKLPVAVRAEALAAKAQASADRAEAMRAKAEAMRARAEAMLAEATSESQAESEAKAEAAATDDGANKE